MARDLSIIHIVKFFGRHEVFFAGVDDLKFEETGKMFFFKEHNIDKSEEFNRLQLAIMIHNSNIVKKGDKIEVVKVFPLSMYGDKVQSNIANLFNETDLVSLTLRKEYEGKFVILDLVHENDVSKYLKEIHEKIKKFLYQ